MDPEDRKTEHYYGDLVRRLFMFAAVVMVVGLPFVLDDIPVPLMVSLLAILVVGVLAGLTNPKNIWVIAWNTLVSAVAVLCFEFFAVSAFIKQISLFFVVNQMLALVFLFALYYSTKSLRAQLMK